MTRKKSTLATLIHTAMLAPWVATALPAAAQDKPSSPAADAEAQRIVVTTRKQRESLLETPASVAVIRGDEIASSGVVSGTQLSGLAPGLTTMQGNSGTSASVRGLGSQAADPAIESSVGTFVDGIYLGRTRDFVMPLYDIDQIELVAGTQATLLGKNTSLGAISITNRRPSKTFGADLSLSHTGKIGATRLQGGVDVPLSPTWALRVAGLLNDEDGFARNDVLGRRERQADERSGRLTLTGKPSAGVDLTAIYQRDYRRTNGANFEVLSDPNGAIAGLAAALGQDRFEATPNDVHHSGSSSLGPGLPAGEDQFDDQTGNRLNLIASFKLGANTVTSQTGYVSWDSTRLLDLDFIGPRLLDLRDRERNRVVSQELRVNSDPAAPISYVMGLYLYDSRWSLDRRFTGQAPKPLPLLKGTQDNHVSIATRAASPFASVRFALADHLKLLSGLRYTQERKTATYERVGTGLFPIVVSPDLPHTTLPRKTSGTVDGDVGLQYAYSPRTMLYATLAKGSKSGVFQSAPDSFAVAEYAGESAVSTEAGVKFDHGSAGSSSFALFHSKIKDFQVGRLKDTGGYPQTVIDNAGARTMGFDVSGRWRASQNLSLKGSVVYSKAQFTENLYSDDGEGGRVLEAFDGMVLTRAPRWTAKLSADYHTAIGAGYGLRVSGSMRYSSEADLQLRASNPEAPKMAAHTLLDLRVALSPADAWWSLELIGTNLTNKRVVTFTSDAPYGDSSYWGTRNRPRTFTLQLNANF
jgi:iron complex outermembrane recepter protein